MTNIILDEALRLINEVLPDFENPLSPSDESTSNQSMFKKTDELIFHERTERLRELYLRGHQEGLINILRSCFVSAERDLFLYQSEKQQYIERMNAERAERLKALKELELWRKEAEFAKLQQQETQRLILEEEQMEILKQEEMKKLKQEEEEKGRLKQEEMDRFKREVEERQKLKEEEQNMKNLEKEHERQRLLTADNNQNLTYKVESVDALQKVDDNSAQTLIIETPMEKRLEKAEVYNFTEEKKVELGEQRVEKIIFELIQQALGKVKALETSDTQQATQLNGIVNESELSEEPVFIKKEAELNNSTDVGNVKPPNASAIIQQTKIIEIKETEDCVLVEIEKNVHEHVNLDIIDSYEDYDCCEIRTKELEDGELDDSINCGLEVNEQNDRFKMFYAERVTNDTDVESSKREFSNLEIIASRINQELKENESLNETVELETSQGSFPVMDISQIKLEIAKATERAKLWDKEKKISEKEEEMRRREISELEAISEQRKLQLPLGINGGTCASNVNDNQISPLKSQKSNIQSDDLDLSHQCSLNNQTEIENFLEARFDKVRHHSRYISKENDSEKTPPKSQRSNIQSDDLDLSHQCSLNNQAEIENFLEARLDNVRHQSGHISNSPHLHILEVYHPPSDDAIKPEVSKETGRTKLLERENQLVEFNEEQRRRKMNELEAVSINDTHQLDLVINGGICTSKENDIHHFNNQIEIDTFKETGLANVLHHSEHISNGFHLTKIDHQRSDNTIKFDEDKATEMAKLMKREQHLEENKEHRLEMPRVGVMVDRRKRQLELSINNRTRISNVNCSDQIQPKRQKMNLQLNDMDSSLKYNDNNQIGIDAVVEVQSDKVRHHSEHISSSSRLAKPRVDRRRSGDVYVNGKHDSLPQTLLTPTSLSAWHVVDLSNLHISVVSPLVDAALSGSDIDLMHGFHGRTILIGGIEARIIPLEPLYLRFPIRRTGLLQEVPRDPRSQP